MVTVSNTQVNVANICGKQYYYRFGMGIEPKSLTLPLTRGIIGHEAMETYYRARQAGGSVNGCRDAALAVLDSKIKIITDTAPEEFETLIMITQLKTLIEAYVEVYRNEPFKILAVEEVFKTSIDTDIDYGMKLDLLVEMTAGEFKGELLLIDHKFVYNFKSEDELSMDGQMPKYLFTLKSAGYPVTRAQFNQIRYRSLKSPQPENIFKRSDARTSRVEIDNIWHEQRLTAKRIYNNEIDETRCLHPLICKNCVFSRLCKAELQNLPIGNMVRSHYRPSTYGYNDLILGGDD